MSDTKIRTINQTIKLIKEHDSDSAITERALREAIMNNEISHWNVNIK